jgi:hypothetical protein
MTNTDTRPPLEQRDSGHFTQLWPTATGRPAEAPLFLAAVSPLRAAALAVLWATSSPGRFVAVLGAVLALVAVLVVAL